MRNLLAEHEYLVGHFYLRRKAWRAAKGRMDVILAAYPEYTRLDKVLYEAGILEGKMGNEDEARVALGAPPEGLSGEPAREEAARAARPPRLPRRSRRRRLSALPERAGQARDLT